ncbi:MAG: methylmalonyl Co-A mutase-associated GTPase MeaB [Bacteroidota bacterium]
MSPSVDRLAEQVFAGDRRGIARAISRVENEASGAVDLLRIIYPKTGTAYRIGITGPPGAGKSTLTNKLARQYRLQGLRVGIIAVDPTSPFTGGALLGDRVRMTEVEMDDGVFIRSMASRGSLGGLSRKAREAADILDAAGHQVILLETVGVGQSELDIAGAADTTVVVLVPESGDGIQAMKAGLMEIADFFVMNKGDRPGADQAIMSITMILGFRTPERTGTGEHDWMPAVVKTVASEGKGIEEVGHQVQRHREFLEKTGTLDVRRRARIEDRIREIIDQRLQVDFWNSERSGVLQDEMNTILDRTRTPYDLAEELLRHFKVGPESTDR